MLNKAKEKIKKHNPKLYQKLIDWRDNHLGFYHKSYSQFGEDLVLRHFVLKDNKNYQGFFIDIGAYHPTKYSNTYYFYQRGWRGLNIDAKPGSMMRFNKKRPKDTNLEIGVALKSDKKEFYIFKEPAFNTFSLEMANKWQAQGQELLRKELVTIDSLSNILDEYLPDNKKIDFMSIDVEGFDLEVLKSNNWQKYRPRYILVELHDEKIENILESEIYLFLKNNNYSLASWSVITLVFKDENLN